MPKLLAKIYTAIEKYNVGEKKESIKLLLSKLEKEQMLLLLNILQDQTMITPFLANLEEKIRASSQDMEGILRREIDFVKSL